MGDKVTMDIFKEYGIQSGKMFQLATADVPTGMMLEFDEKHQSLSKYWADSLKSRDGEWIKISNYYMRDGVPFVESSGFSYIIPLDCLCVYADKKFNPDEGVSFF